MADIVDNFVNVTISIMAEGGASVSCSTTYPCVQTVPIGTTVTVGFTVHNTTSTSDTLFAKLYDVPGLTGGNIVQELWRGILAGGASSPEQTFQYLNVTAAISQSIRVGHVVG